MDRPILHKELPKLAQGYDFVFIDGALRVYDLTRSAIMAVDFVLVPVQPSPLDVWAVHEVVELVQEATIYKPDLTAAFLINRKIANTALGREVTEVLAEYPFPLLKAQIQQFDIKPATKLVNLLCASVNICFWVSAEYVLYSSVYSKSKSH